MRVGVSRAGHGKRELDERSTSVPFVNGDLASVRAHDSSANRQAETHSAIAFAGLGAAIELFEYSVSLVLGDSRSPIGNLDVDATIREPGRHPHRPARCTVPHPIPHQSHTTLLNHPRLHQH